MTRRFKPLPVLEGSQADASNPQVHAAVSASAGTGKTQVLTGRVLRLLLQGARPESLLCLTFTKAGAAEMANRIGARLASWVRLSDDKLRKELFALGEATDPVTLQRARRLFAKVLEAPGGLRIQTIHSFAQTLLAAFPAEAGITPGFQPIEGRAEQELARRTLADLAADAEAGGDRRLIADIQALSLRLGEKSAEGYLLRCAHAHDALAALGRAGAIEPALRVLVGLPEGDIGQLIADACHDDSFDCALLRAIAAANLNWGTAQGRDHADAIDRWMALDSAGRASGLERLAKVVLTGDGERRKVSSGQLKADPDYQAHADRLAVALGELIAHRRADELVAIQAAGLRAGQMFADAHARAKRAAGVADFNDLIGWTRRLLETPGMGDWVRFKLDRRTDHILVDEAQDTNADQWAIIDALTEEFFSGSSEAEERWRTLFMVGDFKQAIFGFQGTDPREFEKARRRARAGAEELVEAEAEASQDAIAREFRDLSISASFRSAPAVLEAVDALIAGIGHEAMGLPERPERHVAHHAGRPGQVEWWPAFEPELEDAGDEGEEGWLDEADRRYATHLARRVKDWLAEAPILATTGRPLCAGDILILVRSRGELASLIVARLFAERVPVAGIDRLHLSRPLAVKDLLAAMAFAAQPLDDLNLANLLVSPLIGWNQGQLYDLAFARSGRLWRALTSREGEGGHLSNAATALRGLLAMADFTTPARFLETILSGPMDGRRKLLGRLGAEARDPIDELLSAALDFERSEIASLDRFLAWFGRGDVEIKRDPSAPVNAVRVMTVHGAKGLEAPVVILADSTSDPAKAGGPAQVLDFPVGERPVPLVRPRKDEAREPFATLIAEHARLDLEEHWRLLYVGATRASERLIVSGVKPRGRIAENSWHTRMERALVSIGAQTDEAAGSLLHATNQRNVQAKTKRAAEPIERLPVPDWLRHSAPVESRPPRPLAPSAIGDDMLASPPPTPGQAEAARRGTLLHLLFERLPGVDPAWRRETALNWLERSASVADGSMRESIADAACSVIGDPAYVDLFGPASLAEAGVAATLDDGRVIAGTVDRLLIEPDRVRVIDFKTGQRVPGSNNEVPRAHQLQMAAYADALRVIFPGRSIEAALLYTAGPILIALDC